MPEDVYDQIKGFVEIRKTYPVAGPLSGSNGYELAGVSAGCLIATICWLFPYPIAAMAHLFAWQHPFGDIMLASLPVMIAFPFAGAAFGRWLWKRRRPSGTLMR